MRTDVLDIAHPSPVRHVPPGGRTVRDGFETVRTPVRIAMRDPSEFEALAPGDPGGPDWRWRHGLFVHDGALWSRLEAWDLLAGGTRAVAGADMLAFVADAGSLSPRFGAELRRQFLGTPLVAAAWGFLPGAEDSTWRAEGVPDGSDAITRDPDAAGLALRAYLRDAIRICDGAAYRRVTPIGHVESRGRNPPQMCHVSRFSLTAGDDVPIRCDMGAVAGAFAFPGRAPDLPGPDGLPPGELIGDEDAVDLANQAPAYVLALGHRLAAVADRRLRGDERRARLASIAAAIAPIEPLALRGRVRMVPLAEAESVHEAAIRAASALASGPGEDLVVRAADTMARYLRQVAIPRLSAAHPDDERDLAGLAP